MGATLHFTLFAEEKIITTRETVTDIFFHDHVLSGASPFPDELASGVVRAHAVSQFSCPSVAQGDIRDGVVDA